MMRQPDHFARRAPFWKYDLPAPNEAPKRQPSLWASLPAPNQINNAYIELSRSSTLARGVGLVIGSAAIISNTLFLVFWAKILLKFGWDGEIWLTALILSIITCTYWFFISAIRLDFALPRDEPMRFNRMRRKVYFYQYEFDRLFLFSRRRWRVKIKVHNWDELIVEACSTYAPGNGGSMERAFIAVRQPGTDKVIARYFFAYDLHQAEQYWEIVRLFMHQGAESLPAFANAPRDWNNDNEVSFIRRLGPKVQWPADVDLESRTSLPSGKTQ